MKIVLFLFILFYGAIAFAQNVGIGTTTPQATLDVKGNQRIGGLSSYIKYDSATGKIEWTNANLYVPATQALMKHSAAADGLFYNNTGPVSGQLEYRNAAGQPVFYTNFTNGNGYFKNFLGIGTTSPSTNLHIESNNSFPVIINGAPSLYLSWAENNFYRGYLGSFAGNPEDVDFGTYSGNTTGKIHFTTQAIPKMTIDALGNVGIGTTTPNATLEVIRGTGFEGTAVFKGTTHGSHFNYGVNENTYIRAGKDNGHVIINDISGGKVGIGIPNPSYKLHINNGGLRVEGLSGSGPILSLSSTGNMEVDAPFIQGGRFLIHENGNIGIGINNPLYRLDVANRMRIRSGGNNNASAGLWLNNNANTEAAFIGMEDDTHVGLFGNNGAGWRFGMNTQSGALRVNGSEGNAGQVLQSNGNASASWGNPLNALYNNMTEYTQSGTLSLGPPFGTSNIPGMSGISLVISSRSKVMFSSSIDVKSIGCFGCGGSSADVIVQVNFPGGSAQSAGIAKGNIATDETKTFVTANKIFTLNPGSYTINTILRSNNISGPTIEGSSGRLDIIVIQE